MGNLHESSTMARATVEVSSNGQSSLSDRVRSLRLKSSGSSPKSSSNLLPWGVACIALATAALFGWRAYRLAPTEAMPAGDQTASTESRPALPGNAAPTVQPGKVVLDSKGYIIAAHQIRLSPQVGGEIIWLDPNFKEGAVYKKGERLAEVDPEIYQARLKSARAALEVAKVNLQEVESGSALKEIAAAQAQWKNMSSKLELSRIDERFKRASGKAIARQDMEMATVQVLVDQAGLDAQKATLDKLDVALVERLLVAKAQLQSAQGALDEAEKNLKNCTIVAPTTGIILNKNAELGGYVNPFAFGAAGYLCEMADLRDLEVELEIQERDIVYVKARQRCRIMPEAGQRDEEFKTTHPSGYSGVVSRLMPVANRSKGSITVRVRVLFPYQQSGAALGGLGGTLAPEGAERAGEFLRPDMSALVSFLK